PTSPLSKLSSSQTPLSLPAATTTLSPFTTSPPHPPSVPSTNTLPLSPPPPSTPLTISPSPATSSPSTPLARSPFLTQTTSSILPCSLSTTTLLSTTSPCTSSVSAPSPLP
ncbi:hypothetical protein V8G54_008372, partial [Vigna mungo]